MKIAIALAAAVLVTVAPVTAQEAAPSTTPATVDHSRLSPNMQSFMSKVDAMRARRQAREGENTSRVLPAGDPVASKGWHKSQGHKHVNWSGASGISAGRRHRRRKAAAAADANGAKAEKVETKEEKKEEKKDDKKSK